MHRLPTPRIRRNAAGRGFTHRSPPPGSTAAAPQFSYTPHARRIELIRGMLQTLKALSQRARRLRAALRWRWPYPMRPERDNLDAYFQASPSQASPPPHSDGGPAGHEKLGNCDCDAPCRVHRESPSHRYPPPFATHPHAWLLVVPKPAGRDTGIAFGFQSSPFAPSAGPRQMLMRQWRHTVTDDLRRAGSPCFTPTPGRASRCAPTSNSKDSAPFDWPFIRMRRIRNGCSRCNRIASRATPTSGRFEPSRRDSNRRTTIPTSSAHSTRDIAFSHDGKQLFVSVGSG